MSENRSLKNVLTLVSILLSIFASIFFFYLVSLKIYWFIPFGIFFILDALITLVGSSKRDRYKGMTTLGNWQVFGLVTNMVYLLIMVLWNDPEQVVPYKFCYIVLGILVGVKFITWLISMISVKKQYHPIMHAFRNQSAVYICYFVLIAGLMITNQLYPGTGEGLFKEKPLFIYIIDISANATLTIFAGLLALSTVVRAKEREQLSTAGKVKHLISWISDNEIGMFFGLIFTMYLAALAFMNVKISLFYLFIGLYYLLIAFVRFINYLWHRSILKHSDGNKIRENRKTSWILLFNAVVYSFFSDLIAVGALLLITNKMTVGTNIYLFLFFLVPFALLKFVLAVRAIRVNRRNNDTYKMNLGYISLISALFSVLEILAISLHNSHKVLKYVSIVASVTVVKVFVIVIAVTFIVHAIRSFVINRRGVEKKYVKNQANKGTN